MALFIADLQGLRRPALILATISAAFVVTCCANNSPELGITATGLNCVDDSPKCIDRRQSALRALLSDPQRRWILQSPDAEAYASGVRLFAFKKSKKNLTCTELNAGIREASGARSALRAASARLTHNQIARGALLGDEVASELRREHNRRCNRG